MRSNDSDSGVGYFAAADAFHISRCKTPRRIYTEKTH